MAAQQPQQQQGDNSLAPMWIIVGIFALLWMIWYFAHAQIAFVILKIRLYESYLISLFTSAIDPMVTTIKNTVPGEMSFNGLADISTAVGSYLRYPIAVVLAILGVAIYFSNPTMRFKKTYSIQSLVESERESWPQIMPVVNLDLVNTDIDTGPWAMGLTPMQFAKKYHLLQEERVVSTDPNVLQLSKVMATVRREEAHRIFSLQLGRYWTGIEHLNPHTKALFAVFAARANRDRDGATKLLLQISASVAHGKLNFAGTDELIEKHKNNKSVVKVTQSHAFVLTVMASMLLLARTDGVLATADFLWLKPVDRVLWYMLNSIGRQTPFTEVAGPYAHWLAERTMQRKLNVPMIDEAVNALEVAIKEVLYIPDDNES
jgi:intracellular multiplication protein IcmP